VGTRRTVILIAAVVVAALAGVATFSYLSGVQTRANKGATLVKVFVVKKDIQKGFPAEQAVAEKYVAQDEIQEKFRPGTAVTDLNTIKGKVALTNLSSNQVVVDGQFVDPKVEQITNSQRIQSGRVAVTVSTDQVRGVGGLLVPGDKVDLLVVDKTLGDGQLRLLYQNVEVLFIGANAAPQPGETQAATNPGSGLITFSVPVAAAQKIVWASTHADGGLYLTLVPPDNQPAAIPPVDNSNLFQGGLTPYEG